MHRGGDFEKIKLKEEGLSWDEYRRCCSTAGEKEGTESKTTSSAPLYALYTELKSVLETMIEIVNYITSCPLKTNLCNELRSEHQGLLFHREVRWPSHGNILNCLYELWDEVRLFSDAA